MQKVLNHKLGLFSSVEGMAFDFVALNLTGFIFLSTYSTVGYFDKNSGVG